MELTDTAPEDSGEARAHFLHNIRQMQNNALLMRVHEDFRLEALYVSEDFAKMMECPVEEALAWVDGPGFLQTTSPEYRPLVRSILRRRVADDGTNSLTIRKLTARGNMIWCHVNYSFIDDFDQHLIYCTYFNVTVLKEYEERLRSVYVSLGNSFYQVGKKTLGLMRVNLARDTIEDVQGRDLYDTDSADRPYSQVISLRSAGYPIEKERTRFLTTFNRKQLMAGYLEGRATASQVLYSRRKDGTFCYVNFSATLARHPLSGDVIAFITEEACNSEKVRETLMTKILVRQFDMVAYLVNGRFGVSIGDAARIQHGSIFPTSRSGIYEQYLCDQVFPVLSGSEEYKAATMKALSLETVARQLRHREPYVVNIAIEMDGEPYYKQFDFYSIDPESDFYVVLKSDTTELQREQIARNEQLRDALEEAKQASVAKTAFLSSMSHEIRTPMNAIIGLDNIALKEPGLSAHTRESLEKIGGSARHLLGLINDILDMTRIESGRMVLKEEEFSFRSMLEQINTMISGQCQDKGLTYLPAVRGEVDEFYMGDDMKLKQVLINILGNAVKFTPAPGTVTFLVERVARFQDQSTLRFTMKDTGIGMDADFLPKIFEAFSQEDATTTNQFGGSGLGMAITKNIVEMMNGTIAVDSEKGAGSTFTVTVTLRNTDHAAPEADESRGGTAPAKLEGRRILLAEDVVINAEIILELLDMRGIRADHAQNGQIAVDLFAQSPPHTYDAVLMDVRMPVLDGLGATRAIRALDHPDAKTVPIIAMTANAFDEDVRRSLQAGMDAHLSKPVEPDRLYETLARLIDRSKSPQGGSDTHV